MVGLVAALLVSVADQRGQLGDPRRLKGQRRGTSHRALLGEEPVRIQPTGTVVLDPDSPVR
jgi:hypothetical protein